MNMSLAAFACDALSALQRESQAELRLTVSR